MLPTNVFDPAQEVALTTISDPVAELAISTLRLTNVPPADGLLLQWDGVGFTQNPAEPVELLDAATRWIPTPAEATNNDLALGCTFTNGILTIPSLLGYIFELTPPVSLSTKPVFTIRARTAGARVFVEVKNTDDTLMTAQKTLLEIPNTAGLFQDFSVDFSQVIEESYTILYVFAISDLSGAPLEISSMSFSPTVPAGSQSLLWDGRRFCDHLTPALPAAPFLNLLHYLNFNAQALDETFRFIQEGDIYMAPLHGYAYTTVPTQVKGQPLAFLLPERPVFCFIGITFSPSTVLWLELKNSTNGSLFSSANGKCRLCIRQSTKGLPRLFAIDLTPFLSSSVEPKEVRVVAFSDPNAEIRIGGFGFLPSFPLEVPAVKPGLNDSGRGIRVAQVEASESTNALAFEVNPAAVGQSAVLFTFISAQGRRVGFPNAAGAESEHASAVGRYFYGYPSGVAASVAHVDNWEAQYFWKHVISARSPAAIPDRIVNQSWVFGDVTTNGQETIDSLYDAYAARHNVLFVSTVGDGGAVSPPSTCYNGIAVAAYGGASSVGPTAENGRCKPDLSATGAETSFAPPQVAAAAAALAQAALRGDCGRGSRSAADIRVLKALLLNGAIKPPDWTNAPDSPLDPRYGAGICNGPNAHKELLGGKHGYSASNMVATGDPHPPVFGKRSIASRSGFDFNRISSNSRFDGLRHYGFQLGSGTNTSPFTAKATLVWNRRPGKSTASNLDLFLYNSDSGALVSWSASQVDNVEHLFVTGLQPGNYDLQVRKVGGLGHGGAETYALAFEFDAR